LRFEIDGISISKYYNKMKNKTFGSSSTAEQVIDANHPSSMEGRIVVITGCNSGIGLETAKQFYRKNATVVMACRSEEKMAASRNEIIEQVPNSSGVLDMIVLDLGSLASVDSFAQSFTQKYDKLHTLM
jgi:NAD(P)-dependent dehydrogenase (short-subunit alcohol dehydrogenase family)